MIFSVRFGDFQLKKNAGDECFAAVQIILLQIESSLA